MLVHRLYVKLPLWSTGNNKMTVQKDENLLEQSKKNSLQFIAEFSANVHLHAPKNQSEPQETCLTALVNSINVALSKQLRTFQITQILKKKNESRLRRPYAFNSCRQNCK